jgi:hypothetical protein
MQHNIRRRVSDGWKLTRRGRRTPLVPGVETPGYIHLAALRRIDAQASVNLDHGR